MEEIKLIDIGHENETRLTMETKMLVEIETESQQNSPHHCVNCYLPLQNQNQNQNNTNIKSDLPLKIPQSLSSLYKLNYLPAFLDEEEESIWTGQSEKECEHDNIKLCDNCLDVFLNLYNLYEDFNHLRSIQSCLAKQIQKLDDCVKAHQVIRKINSETNDLKPKLGKRQSKNQSQRRVRPSKRNKTTSKNKKQDKVSTLKSGPWVVIKRLENDPVAQTAFTRSSKRIQEKTKLLNVNTKSNVKVVRKKEPDSSASEDDDDDDDFCPGKEEEGDEDEDEENESCRVIQVKGGELVPIKKNKNEENGANSSAIAILHTKCTKVPIRYLNKRKAYAVYRHRKTKVPNPCWSCTMDFVTPSELYNHTMIQHYKKGLFVCTACSRINDTKVAHSMHAKKCASLKPGHILPTYKCEFCAKTGTEKEFALKSELQSHLALVHDEKTDSLYCTVEGCSFKARNQYYLKSHIQRHERRKKKPQPNTTCQECGRVFKSKHILKAHMFKLHTEEGMQKNRAWLEKQREKRKQKAAEQTTFCSDCNVEFFSFMSLLHHRKEFHGADFPFVCDICGRRFSGKDNLKYHVNHSHSSRRDYICDLCGRTYKQSRHLKEHRKTHSEDGRRSLNARVRLRNKRKRLIKQALAQTLTQQQEQQQIQNQPLPLHSSTTTTITTNGTTTNNTIGIDNAAASSLVQPEQLTTLTTCQLIDQNPNNNNNTTTIEYEMATTTNNSINNINNININNANLPPPSNLTTEQHFVIATTSQDGNLGFNSNLQIGLTFQQF